MKKTLILAGSLMVGLLFFSVQAKAQSGPFFYYNPGPYSKANYNGRYACHGNSNAGDTINTTATYVVAPNGYGHYNDGALCINFDPKKTISGCDCTFQLETYGYNRSYYVVDSKYGIVSETLNWKDYSYDGCKDESFTDLVQGALVAIGNTPSAATQTLFTDVNLDTNGGPIGNLEGTYPGSGNCVMGGTIPFTDRE